MNQYFDQGPAQGHGSAPDETMRLRAVPAADETMRLGVVPAAGGPSGPVEPAGTGQEAARPSGRARLTKVLPTVLVAAAVIAGAVFTGITVHGSDRTTRTVSWGKAAEEAADPAGDVSQGRHDTALTKMLLPATQDWTLGPDIEQYGNDAELSGKQAEAVLKNAAVGLSGKARRDYERHVERMGAQGVGLRSYQYLDNSMVAEMRITRLKDKQAIRDAYLNSTALFKELGVMRKGPTIEGFGHASCFRWPADSKHDLDGMICTAYQDDLLIDGDFYGSKPFSSSEAAALFKKQLEHLSSPGDYI